jgi:group I intron endonuclease
MKSCIYSIRFSENIYIGSTKNFSARRSKHLTQLRSGNHHSNRLQRAFEKYGEERIQFEILEECPVDQLQAVEQEYINRLKPRYNSTTDVYCPSRDPEVSEKIRQTLTGRKRDPEIGRKSGNTQRGKKLTEEHRKKLSEALLGRPRSEETRRKISVGNKGKPKSAEHRAKMSEVRRGKKQSPEHIAKAAAARIGHVVTEETRQKISAANKGRTVPQEQRDKLRELNRDQFIAVMCIETGEVFETMQAAADSRGKTRQSLTCHLQGKSKTFAKQHWKLVEKTD